MMAEHRIYTTYVPRGRKRAKYEMRTKFAGMPGYLPAEPVRAHVQTLTDYGLPQRSIARDAGVSETCVLQLLAGRSETVRVRHALALMKASYTPNRRQERVLAIGARRRIHALRAIGWSWAALTEQSSLTEHQLRGLTNKGFGTTSYENWKTVVDMYERLSATPGSSKRSIQYGRQFDWATPLAWEGRDIDHPDHKPEKGDDTGTSVFDEVLFLRILAGNYEGEIPTPERKAVIDYAIEHGWTKFRVAELLNLKPATADQALIRRRREIRNKEAAA